MEVVVTPGAIGRANLQSNHHHQQTNTQFFYRPDALPVAQPTASKHWREKYHPVDLLTPNSCGVFQLCLWPIIAPGYLGRFAKPLIIPLIAVPQWRLQSKLIKLLTQPLVIACVNPSSLVFLHFVIIKVCNRCLNQPREEHSWFGHGPVRMFCRTTLKLYTQSKLTPSHLRRPSHQRNSECAEQPGRKIDILAKSPPRLLTVLCRQPSTISDYSVSRRLSCGAVWQRSLLFRCYTNAYFFKYAVHGMCILCFSAEGMFM